MSWESGLYIWPLLFSAALLVSLAVYAMRYRRVATAGPFSFTIFSTSFWCLAAALELLQPDLPSKLVWVYAQYLSYTTGTVGWLVMTLRYAGRSQWLTRSRLAGICAIPLITLLLVTTNDQHGMILYDAHLYSVGPLTLVSKTFGPWFWVFAAYSYSLLMACVYLLADSLLRMPSLYRGQPLALLVGTTMPMLSSLLYNIGWSPIQHFDTTPIVLGVSGVVVSWGLFRHRLLDIVPVAHDKVIESMRDGIIVLDAAGQVVELNLAAQRTVGYPFSRALGMPASQALQTWPELAQLCYVTEAHTELELGEGDTKRSYEVQVYPLSDRRGHCLGRVISLHDITERVRAEDSLQEMNRRLMSWVGELEQRNRESNIMNEMGDLLQTCLTVEEAYEVVAHCAQRLFPGESGGLFVAGSSSEIMEAVATWGGLPAEERAFDTGECWALRRGRLYTPDDPRLGRLCRHGVFTGSERSICMPLLAQGEALGLLHHRAEACDSEQTTASGTSVWDGKQKLVASVAEHVALALASLKLRQKLREQAIRDGLTGLYNRRYMGETLERELARAARRDASLGLIMLDIDHFKQFNDLYGHEAGDALLQALSQYLQCHIRGEDAACRYGGEEFVLILPDASLEDARVRAEELRDGVQCVTVEQRGQRLGPVRVSLGVATYPQHGRSVVDLLRAADLALYRAKHEGRDRVAVAPAATVGVEVT